MHVHKYICFLTSLCLTGFRIIYLTRSDSYSFLCMAEYYSMVYMYHQLDRHECEQAPGVGDGQGGLRAAVHGVTKSRTRLSTALICVQHVLIHSSVDEHLGCFRVLAIENTAAVNFGDTHVFLNYSFLRVCAL